ACVAVAFFITLGQTRVYRAEAMLRLDPDPPRPLGQRVELVSDNANLWNRREFYESEFRIMRSRRVAVATVRALGLNASPAFLGVKPTDRAKFKPISETDAADILISRLTVEPVRDSSLATLAYDDTDPERCQQVLSTVVRIYLEQNLETTAQISASALERLNKQLA